MQTARPQAKPLPGTEPGASALNLAKPFKALKILLLVAAISGAVQLLMDKPTVRVGDATVQVEVARTKDEWVKGLSGRTSLNANEGMLFVFSEADYWPVWMKDMHISLDLVWVDANKQVVNIQHNVSPATYPKAFIPDKPALYLLELPAGAAAAGNIQAGQTASFNL